MAEPVDLVEVERLPARRPELVWRIERSAGAVVRRTLVDAETELVLDDVWLGVDGRVRSYSAPADHWPTASHRRAHVPPPHERESTGGPPSCGGARGESHGPPTRRGRIRAGHRSRVELAGR